MISRAFFPSVPSKSTPSHTKKTIQLFQIRLLSINEPAGNYIKRRSLNGNSPFQQKYTNITEIIRLGHILAPTKLLKLIIPTAMSSIALREIVLKMGN